MHFGGPDFTQKTAWETRKALSIIPDPSQTGKLYTNEAAVAISGHPINEKRMIQNGRHSSESAKTDYFSKEYTGEAISSTPKRV